MRAAYRNGAARTCTSAQMLTCKGGPTTNLQEEGGCGVEDDFASHEGLVEAAGLKQVRLEQLEPFVSARQCQESRHSRMLGRHISACAQGGTHQGSSSRAMRGVTPTRRKRGFAYRTVACTVWPAASRRATMGPATKPVAPEGAESSA